VLALVSDAGQILTQLTAGLVVNAEHGDSTGIQRLAGTAAQTYIHTSTSATEIQQLFYGLFSHTHSVSSTKQGTVATFYRCGG